MTKYRNFVILLLASFILSGFIFAQIDDQPSVNFSIQNQTEHVQNLFSSIEYDLNTADVAALSKYFSSQTYLSLENGVNGYYSSNQAYYVLESFFKDYHVVSFKLNNIKTDPDNPYATGVYDYDLNGKRDSVQVYLSLKKIGDSWKITQISID